jgi:hypothetical protein
MLTALIASLALAPPGLAQSTEEALRSLQREVEALKEGQSRLQKEVQDLRSLLRARRQAAPAAVPAAPGNLVLSLGDDPVKGDPGARLVLVDFTDYQ